MKGMREIRYYFSLEIEHTSDVILAHQKAYIGKILKYFNFDDAHPMSTLMIVHFLNPKKNLFRPKEDDDTIYIRTSYLSAICTSLYLTNVLVFFFCSEFIG